MQRAEEGQVSTRVSNVEEFPLRQGRESYSTVVTTALIVEAQPMSITPFRAEIIRMDQTGHAIYDNGNQ